MLQDNNRNLVVRSQEVVAIVTEQVVTEVTVAAAQAAALAEHPLVKAVKAAFPEARIITETGPGDAGAQPWSKRA